MKPSKRAKPAQKRNAGTVHQHSPRAVPQPSRQRPQPRRRRFLSKLCPNSLPSGLSTSHVALLNAWVQGYESPFTRQCRASAARLIFRTLCEVNGAPPLARFVCSPPVPRPRNVTATEAEREALLNAAPPQLLCYILLCSDMAIRSGTALRLGPSHYDAEAQLLRFRTKYQSVQALPVTSALQALFALCTNPDLPFVAQLPRGFSARGAPLRALGRAKHCGLNAAFRRLCKSVGITRRLNPHDLRRTTARRVYDITKDLRVVQSLLGHSDLTSTLWYLQADVAPVSISTLELAKLPTKGVQ